MGGRCSVKKVRRARDERLQVASRSRPCRVMHDAWKVGLGGVAWDGCVIVVEGI